MPETARQQATHSDTATVAAADLRRCLGQFATGVTVVTAQGLAGEPVGMTLNSFTSVSLEPPLVLFCIAKSANSLEDYQRAPGFAVNVLAAAQQGLSSRFARPLTEKWADLDWQPGFGGAPLLNGTLAVLECSPHAVTDAGDHVIFIARVERIMQPEDGQAPLLFWGGRYHNVDTDNNTGD